MHSVTLEYRPYSPDLSSRYCYLLAIVEDERGRVRFDNDQDVEDFVDIWLMIEPQNLSKDLTPFQIARENV